MDSLDKLVKSAKKFNLGNSIKERKKSLSINIAISVFSELIIKLLLVTGAFFGLKNSGHESVFIALQISLAVFIFAEILTTIDNYRIRKQLEAEYEKFVLHMEKEGFSKSDMSSLTKSLTKEQLSSKFEDNP